MIYRGGFVLARMEDCDTFWFVKVYLISNSHDSPGITLAQNFRATSRLRPGDLERCFNKQGDTRLHVAAVLTR